MSADIEGPYRYSLTRDVSGPGHQALGRRALFVMLNPSTADAEKDDPTIRRCMRFARDFRCDRLEVVNLFAWRATNPKELKSLHVMQAIGPRNNEAIRTAAGRAAIVICAWGTGGRLFHRDEDVATILGGYQPHVLDFTKDGHPKHPLYIPATARPIPWRAIEKCP